MKTITKILLILTLVLLQAPLSTIQSNPDIEAFRNESPDEQTEAGFFRSPSELTLEEDLHNPFRATANDGWLELPDNYGDTGNALKLPVANGWGILILASVFYIFYLYLSARRSRKKALKESRSTIKPNVV